MIGQNIFTDADKIESHQKDPIVIYELSIDLPYIVIIFTLPLLLSLT